MTAIIELFAQASWHDDGAIRLNRAGATQLVKALEEFLASGKAMAETFASDGEGYSLYLIDVDSEHGERLNHYLDVPGMEPNSGGCLVYEASKA